MYSFIKADDMQDLVEQLNNLPEDEYPLGGPCLGPGGMLNVVIVKSQSIELPSYDPGLVVDVSDSTLEDAVDSELGADEKA